MRMNEYLSMKSNIQDPGREYSNPGTCVQKQATVAISESHEIKLFDQDILGNTFMKILQLFSTNLLNDQKEISQEIKTYTTQCNSYSNKRKQRTINRKRHNTCNTIDAFFRYISFYIDQNERTAMMQSRHTHYLRQN